MWGLGRIVITLLLAGALVMAGWLGLRSWHPSADRYPVQGVDVSAATGVVDWNALAANGADFAYAVATVGARDRDPAFEANWRGAGDAGLRRGAIHAYALCQPAAAQADAFNTVVPRDAQALPAAVSLTLDPGCTPTREALVADLQTFLGRVETHTGKPLLLLLPKSVEREYRLSEALPRSLWATGTLLRPNYAARPWRMWRASNLRRVEGAEGPINWDVAAS